MSSSDRRLFLTGLAALAGCGFTPLYAPGGAGEALRGRIAIDDPEDPEGFVLVRRLEARLGLPQAPEYRLSASIALGQDAIGITPDQQITRFNQRGEVTYALMRLSDDVVVSSGKVANFTSFSATGTTVSTLSAEQDAVERLMVVLADQLVARLLASAPSWLT